MRLRLFLIAVCPLPLLVPESTGAAEAQIRSFDIPAEAGDKALKRFSAQAGLEVIFGTATAAQVTTNAVKGDFAPREAIALLLEGTGLVVIPNEKTGALTISRAPDEPGDSDRSPESAKKKDTDTPETQEPMKRNRLFAKVTTALALLVAPTDSVQAQAATAQTNTSAVSETVVLSPFVVDTTADRGYQAEHTLSGSRLNSRLRDTPASVSVFTPEFIQDVGLSELTELISYSVNAQLDLNDTSSSLQANSYVNAQSLVKQIDIRGIPASQGLDYFKSITPDDSYRIDRYDESRGPNSILFGISNSGGLLNQSSRMAVTHRDRARLHYSFGSNDRNRTELNVNKVLMRDKLALAIAAVHQENGGWKMHSFDDKDRIFGAVTVKPVKRLTLRVMGETGRENRAVHPPFMPADEALAWLDNRNARGVAAVTIAPLNANPTAAQQALGITARNSNANGVNRRLTYIENDGTLFDAVGTYLTGSYNNPAVRSPDGTPGVSGSTLKVNDPGFMPYHVNASGSGMFRRQDLENVTLLADWELTESLFANVGYNYQMTNITLPFVTGVEPVLRGDPNTTLGVRGPANPYVGRLYFDGNWREDRHRAEYEELRASLSYNLSTRRFGTHRIAGLLSRVEEKDTRVNTWLALAGAPFGGAAADVNNRVAARFYIDENDPATFRIGDWRRVPSRLTVDGTAYDVRFMPAAAGAQNSHASQTVDTMLIVAQSHFFQERLVTTLGFRRDSARITSYGHDFDPVNRIDVITLDPAKATVNDTNASTRTQGVVFHAFDWLSLVANRASSAGLPDFTRKIFPDALTPDPSSGKGEDYGVSLRLLGGRLNTKAVYFTTREEGMANAGVSSGLGNRNRRITTALGTVLSGPGRPFTAAQWTETQARFNPAVNGILFDLTSKGYELSTVANPTPNWRLMLNYSYTDRIQANGYARDVVPWYGFKLGERGLIVEGVRQNADGSFTLDPAAFESQGAIAEWLQLAGMRPEAGVSALTTENGITIAEELFQMILQINNIKRENEQRWGLRPHLFSLFTAYDFTQGRLKGFSVGGGYRWRSPNIMGMDASGNERKGRAIQAADLMLRYKRKIPVGRIDGNMIFQINVVNLFDQKGIIPTHVSSTTDFVVPGGRGVAYSRFGLIEPRSYRFSLTYEF